MLIPLLGRGSFGTIRKVKRMSDGHVCQSNWAATLKDIDLLP